MCESDPQKDHENDEEYHINDQCKIHQHWVGFHLICFVTVSSPNGADLAARRLPFVRRSLSVKGWHQRKNRREREKKQRSHSGDALARMRVVLVPEKGNDGCGAPFQRSMQSESTALDFASGQVAQLENGVVPNGVAGEIAAASFTTRFCV